MSEFLAERLYVPLDFENERANQGLASSLRPAKVRIVVGANATEFRGLYSLLASKSISSYSGTLADMRYSTVDRNIERSLEMFQELPSIGFVSVDGRSSERSLRSAAQFNNGLQLVAKMIDPNISDDEYRERFGRSIEYDTLSMCETAAKCGIGSVMLAGAEVGLVRANYPDAKIFASGIRPAVQLPECGIFNDDQVRTADPINVLEAGGENTNLIIGRPVSSASEPLMAAEALIAYSNKG